MLLQEMKPIIPLQGVIFLEAAILPPNKLSTSILVQTFGKWAATKRYTWPKRSNAYADISSNVAFQNWDPEVVKSFVVN